MLYFDGLGGLIVLAVWIFCFIDVILTPPEACRNLPKLAWVFIVLILPDIGSIAWLIAGRPWNRAGVATQSSPRAGRPQNRAQPKPSGPTNPDDDEAFLAGLQRRADEQRRRAREQNTDRLDGDKT